MTRFTIVLLVVLRLAIGWHLFYEGWKKLSRGSFTGEDYLRESVGPLAPVFRGMVGDPLADKLTPKYLPADADPTKVDPSQLFPPALAKEWDAWFANFCSHYRLIGDQKSNAQTKFDHQKSQFVEWLRNSRKTTAKPSASVPSAPPVPLEQSVAERIVAYHEKQQEGRDYQAKEFRRAQGTFYEDEAKVQLATLRRDASSIRNSLKNDLAEQSAAMRNTVTEAADLTAEQWAKEPAPASVKPGLFQRGVLGWVDVLVPWSLLLAGVCLMLGLGTRIAAIGAAILLLSFYLAMPPWPGLPEPPQVEGHYLVINKNLIEIAALLLLAASATGRWFGLDGLIALLRKSCCAKKNTLASGGPQPPVALGTGG